MFGTDHNEALVSGAEEVEFPECWGSFKNIGHEPETVWGYADIMRKKSERIMSMHLILFFRPAL